MASPDQVSDDTVAPWPNPPILLSNRYQVISVLGDGGFGKTFLVEDIQMPSGRRCVLKQLKPIHEETTQLRQLIQDRFQREAATLETLGEAHDQIPRLYAYFSEGGQFYLVEEWVEGMTLAQKVQQEGRQSEATVQTIVANLLPAIACIHSHGIVHRDIKPDNVILRSRDGKPVLIDFGAVKETMNTLINSQAHSSHSIVVGTPGYMPAEQLSGRPVYASDLYGLGMTAIYMLTGKIPQEIDIDPQTGQLRWREHAPNLSAEFGNFLDCATHISTQSRFANVQDMQSILNTLMMSRMTAQASQPTQPVSQPQSAQTVISALPDSPAGNTTVVAPVDPSYSSTPSQPYAGTQPQSLLQQSPQAQWKSALIMGSLIGVSILLGAVVLIKGLPTVLADGSEDSVEPVQPESISPQPAALDEPTAPNTETVETDIAGGAVAVPTPTSVPTPPSVSTSPAARSSAAAANANATVSGQSGTKNVRSGAGTNHSVIAEVSVGDRVRVVGRGNDSDGYPWYRVVTPAGSTGWLAGQLISIDGDAAPSPSARPTPARTPASTTNATIVSKEAGSKNVRSGPGTTYAVKHIAYPGDRILVRDRASDSGGYTWYKVYFPKSGAEGWMAAQLVSLD